MTCTVPQLSVSQRRPPVAVFDSGILVWKGIVEVQGLMAARRSKQMGRSSRGSVRWHPPLPGSLKLNCDGTVNSDRKEVGVGGVFRNENGDFLGAVGKRIG